MGDKREQDSTPFAVGDYALVVRGTYENWPVMIEEISDDGKTARVMLAVFGARTTKPIHVLLSDMVHAEP